MTRIPINKTNVIGIQTHMPNGFVIVGAQIRGPVLISVSSPKARTKQVKDMLIQVLNGLGYKVQKWEKR